MLFRSLIDVTKLAQREGIPYNRITGNARFTSYRIAPYLTDLGRLTAQSVVMTQNVNMSNQLITNVNMAYTMAYEALLTPPTVDSDGNLVQAHFTRSGDVTRSIRRKNGDLKKRAMFFKGSDATPGRHVRSGTSLSYDLIKSLM